jgi:BolA family transcriptional regulator, general stress-responsive regulator
MINILNEIFKDSKLEVIDNSNQHKGHNDFDGNEETHFIVILEMDKKSNKNRLEIHRQINNSLSSEFNSGLHSLEIKII